jgi:hypothetical protein
MATNFLLAPGTNGFIVTPFNLMSTELNALAINATIISSVGGTSGVFNQTSFGSAIWGNIWFASGGAFTPTAGGYLAGWFVQSSDGGTTFELNVGTTIGLPRPPDFTIPLWVSAYAATNISFASGFVKLPWASCKVLILNASGVALSASGHTIKCGPVAIQY